MGVFCGDAAMLYFVARGILVAVVVMVMVVLVLVVVVTGIVCQHTVRVRVGWRRACACHATSPSLLTARACPHSHSPHVAVHVSDDFPTKLNSSSKVCPVPLHCIDVRALTRPSPAS
jgi:hypothetical protein